MSTSRRYFMAGVATAAAVATVLPGRASAAVTLDLSEVLPDENWQTIEIRRFAEEVAQATNGEVTIRIHSGGALGLKGPEHLRAVRDGLVPMADVLGAQQVSDVPLFKLQSLPFIVETPEELLVLHNTHLKPHIDAAAERYNQKFLASMPSPQNFIFLKVKADTLEGLQNIKVRAADMVGTETFNAIGLTGIQVPWGELIPALATGRVDGVGTSATSAVDGKFWEFMTYIYPTNHIWAQNYISINLDTWNSLAPEHQEAITRIAAEQEPLFWAASKRLGDEALATLQEHGMELVEISDEMRAEMRERTRHLLEGYLEEVPEAREIVEAFRAG